MEGTTLMAKKEKTPQEIFAEQFVAELQPKTVEDVEQVYIPSKNTSVITYSASLRFNTSFLPSCFTFHWTSRTYNDKSLLVK